MSEERKNRRKFLADALFAGGGLAAAAVATRWFIQKDTPPPITETVPVASPTLKPEPEPKASPTSQSLPRPNPHSITRDPFVNPQQPLGGAVCPPTPKGK